MTFTFPKIYPILDSSFIPPTGRAEFLRQLGGSLAEAGVTLLEYRNKTGVEAELLADAAILREALPAGQVKLILDDRADLVEQLGFDGVHVDAGDLSPAEARKLLGPDRTIGTFGGSSALVAGILQTPADYFPLAWFTRPGPNRLPSRRPALKGCAGCAPRLALARCLSLSAALRWPRLLKSSQPEQQL